jgi:hypothetical protein
MTLRNKSRIKLSTRLAMLTSIGFLMSACMTQTNPAYEGIGYREARFAEISAMRSYRTCRDQALELDKQARKEGTPSRYLASARLIDKCESELGSNASKIAQEERIRTYAISIQNYFKGGNIVKARNNLEKLRNGFSGKDLYLADGSSFIETMEVILSLKSSATLYDLALANINQDLKSEFKRLNYWNKN